jgi:lipopolysaccharide export system protein LptA
MKHALLIATFAFSTAVTPALAQGVPNPFSGMGRDSDAPIAIQADSTTADMRNETATYSGNVRVTQGNLHLRSDTLAIKAAKGTIERIEAQGNVVLASPQGQATGSTALYDISERVVKLGGKVVLVNGQNVLQGTSLVVNLATGRADLTGGGPGGRVSGVFVPAKTPKISIPGNPSKPAEVSKDAPAKP